MSFLSPHLAPTAGPWQTLDRPGMGKVELLRYASLLCGLGPQAGELITWQDWAPASPPVQGRTCIDAGSSLIFSLLAPGRRSLRLMIRLGPPSAGVVAWRRFHQRAGEPVQRWHTESYLGEPSHVWQRVKVIARRAGGLDRLRRTHAVLGPRGRIYSLSYALDGRLEATVSWHLDRHVTLDGALELLGYKGVWTAAREVWESLLGFPASLHTGPWSLLLPLHDSQPRLRIGSTNWARRIEDGEKRRRLAALVDRLGGDGRYADALYKLIAGEVQTARRPAIGRAVEVEILDGQVVAAEFFLCTP